MQPSRFLFTLVLLLAPIALLGTTWLYLYPVLHGCSFPIPPPHVGHSQAPFRLLALGDPQLEGDSSLPDPNVPVFPSLEWFIQDMQHGPDTRTRIKTLRRAIDGLVHDGLKYLEGKRKAVDLWGNDLYLAHIVRSVRWWSKPSHVAVLGDLLGSQWITDGEFEKRAGRYWGVVMKGFEGVPRGVYGMVEEEQIAQNAAAGDVEQEVTEEVDSEQEQKLEAEGRSQLIDALQQRNQVEAASEDKTERDEESKEEVLASQSETEDESEPLRKPYWGGTTEVLGADEGWANRVINIAGNHDVGYAGDLDESRVERFEKAFGNVNWDIWFTLPPVSNSTNTSEQSASADTNDAPPALRIVVLNSMNIDTPAWSYDLQIETYSFMNHIITTARPVEDKTHATILLTHIPLEKQAGICVDSPFFDFFDGGHGVKEQNMLSDHSTKTILEGVFGMSENKWAAGGGFGRRGIVLNGHDHEGCDVVHFIRQEGAEEACEVDHVMPEDAYWPAPTSNPVLMEPEASMGTMDGLVAKETSSVNETNPLIQTSPAEKSSATLDPPTEPVPEPTGWLAHPFPHRPYHISHDSSKNISTCTSISASPHLREITLRSMMGDFSGHAGFLSAWFDKDKGEKGEWVFEFRSCGVGVQHWWWGVHSVDVALVVISILGGIARVVERRYAAHVNEGDKGNAGKRKADIVDDKTKAT